MAAPPAARYDHATPQGGRGAPPASTVLLPPTPFDPRLPRRALKLNQYGQPSFIKVSGWVGTVIVPLLAVCSLLDSRQCCNAATVVVTRVWRSRKLFSQAAHQAHCVAPPNQGRSLPRHKHARS